MSAILSSCGLYRYRLERDSGLPGIPGKVFAFFGVNPSTADAHINDATVRKWISFSKLNGGRRTIVGNVFAFRSTDVTNLRHVDDPVGPENAAHLIAIAADADILVPCWGASGKLPKELRHHLGATLDLLRATGKPLMTFGLTASGDPKHPLMLPYSTKLQELGA